MFRLPPLTRDPEGERRRIGFELEFAGLPPDEACAMIASLVGGRVEVESPFRSWVRSTPHGDFRVEIDSSYLSDQRYIEILAGLGFPVDLPGQELLETLMASLATPLVPVEVVSPPLPIDEAPVMDELREELRLGKARGTRMSILYAFGLHLNVTAPSHDAREILRVIQAYLLADGWLREAIEVDGARRLGPHIEPFPVSYRRLVLDPSYAPTGEELLGDYLAHNPTRNRPLDMLPLLGCIDEKRVLASIEDPELHISRLAFHYRLPDSRVDDPGWRIAGEWDRWVEVERLAYDAALLGDMIVTYARTVGS
jgi:hypothetical protein